MITVTGLAKSYGPIEAVRGIDFTVERGEIVGLLGHNGAGKTTVMKMITGCLEPSQGTVTVGGKDVLEETLQVQQQIGYLPETAPLYPEMLVQEYLLMVATLRGLDAGVQEKAVAEAVKSCGLDDKLLRPIATLSRGYRQRVGLAQAIVHKPRVLILDEPTNGLDPMQIMEIRRLIKRLAVDSTVILSTHILQEVEAVCDRAVILIDGLIAADATLAELLQSPQMTLSVKEDGQNVEGTLLDLSQVKQVWSEGSDPGLPGFNLYRIETEPNVHAAAAIGEAARSSGWALGGLIRDTPNLEAVFNQLMDTHVANKGGSSDVSKTDASTSAKEQRKEVAA